jgi:hypothetical protein
MTNVRSTGSSFRIISNSLIALSRPDNCTKLSEATLLPSVSGKKGSNERTSFCASVAEFRSEAHQSENALEYVIGNIELLIRGRWLVEVDAAVEAMAARNRFEARMREIVSTKRKRKGLLTEWKS